MTQRHGNHGIARRFTVSAACHGALANGLATETTD